MACNVAMLEIREDPGNDGMLSVVVTSGASSCTSPPAENESTMKCPQETTLEGK